MSDLYPAPPVPDYEYVFNFQIWASSSEDAHDLLRRTLANLDGFGPGWTVRFDNAAEPSPPSVVIREAELDGAVVRMTVRSWLDETRSVHFYGNMAFPSDRVTGTSPRGAAARLRRGRPAGTRTSVEHVGVERLGTRIFDPPSIPPYDKGGRSRPCRGLLGYHAVRHLVGDFAGR